ncbi:MAG: metallophosphoesterase [Gammaproteobacteria bacterium]|nr:metallophosphoesterase [Gammaproteobacteria bacterium]
MAGENLRIIAFGDVHMELGNAGNIPGIGAADFIIVTGDITNYGSREDAQKVLDQLLAINSNVLGLHGNLDQPDVGTYLEDLGLSLHGRGRVMNGIGLVGLGGSNFTPFNTPSEFSEPELATLLIQGYAQTGGTQPIILVSHTPPWQTKTDRIAGGAHVGSTAVRQFIEQKQPALCLTGHIHESKAVDRIGRTMILNPGMIKNGSYIEVTLINGELTACLKP